jgi:hypothetical protein
MDALPACLGEGLRDADAATTKLHGQSETRRDSRERALRKPGYQYNQTIKLTNYRGT